MTYGIHKVSSLTLINNQKRNWKISVQMLAIFNQNFFGHYHGDGDAFFLHVIHYTL
jgi:hypothetical protein